MPQSRPRAVVALMHGFAEHSGRYAKHAPRFCDEDIALAGYDHEGHGRSDGRRGYVDDFSCLVTDACDFVDRLSDDFPDTPIFALGQSMGGCLAALSVVGRQDRLAGLIMTSPAIAVMQPPWMQKLVLRLSPIIPRLGTKPLSRGYLSTDLSVARDYKADPLTFCGRVAIRTAAEIIRLGEATMAAAPKITLPLLVIHGTSDRITSPSASAAFYEAASSSDKSISFYRDMYHETHNEPGGNRVWDGVIEFVVEHCTGNGDSQDI